VQVVSFLPGPYKSSLQGHPVRGGGGRFATNHARDSLNPIAVFRPACFHLLAERLDVYVSNPLGIDPLGRYPGAIWSVRTNSVFALRPIIWDRTGFVLMS